MPSTISLTSIEYFLVNLALELCLLELCWFRAWREGECKLGGAKFFFVGVIGIRGLGFEARKVRLSRDMLGLVQRRRLRFSVTQIHLLGVWKRSWSSIKDYSKAGDLEFLFRVQFCAWYEPFEAAADWFLLWKLFFNVRGKTPASLREILDDIFFLFQFKGWTSLLQTAFEKYWRK